MSEDVTRTKLFEALHASSATIPEMRAGQHVAALGELCADLNGRGLCDASDGELLVAVWQYRRDFEVAAPA